VQRRCRERQHLDVKTRLVHQRESLLGEIEEPILDHSRVVRDAGIHRGQTKGMQRVADFGRQDVLLDADQFHGGLLRRFGRFSGRNGCLG
jgi:hypothetical protein